MCALGWCELSLSFTLSNRMAYLPPHHTEIECVSWESALSFILIQLPTESTYKYILCRIQTAVGSRRTVTPVVSGCKRLVIYIGLSVICLN